MNFLKLFKLKKYSLNLNYEILIVTSKSTSSSTESDDLSVELMQLASNPDLSNDFSEFPFLNPDMPYDPSDEISYEEILEHALYMSSQYDDPVPELTSSSATEKVESSSQGNYVLNKVYSLLTASDPTPDALFEKIQNEMEPDEEEIDR